MRRVLVYLSATATLLLGTPVAAADFVAPERVSGVASASDSDTLHNIYAGFRLASAYMASMGQKLRRPATPRTKASGRAAW